MLNVEFFLNALMAGILLGGFYAAISVGLSLSFGLLDVVNIAHPAFILCGSYVTFYANEHFGVDPIIAGVVFAVPFYFVGVAVYRIYYNSFEKTGGRVPAGAGIFLRTVFPDRSHPHHHLGGGLPPRPGVLHRKIHVHRPGGNRLPAVRALPGGRDTRHRPVSVSLQNIFRTRRHGRGAGQPRRSTHGGRPHPDQDGRVRHQHRHRRDRRFPAHHHRPGRTDHRARVHRPCLRGHRPRRGWAA